MCGTGHWRGQHPRGDLLQNRTTPERSANIPYGTQLTLYETYANHPERIEYDFGGCSMGSLSLAKDALTAAFSVSVPS